MSIKLFIAGTDTEIGKTYVSVGMLHAYNRMGLSTLGIKPVATGCRMQQNKLYNDDALALQRASSIKLTYDDHNPVALAAPASPNIIAKQMQQPVTVQMLKQKMHTALTHPADMHIIEGIGGWYVPINENETMADLVKALQFDVILVIGIRLGCINHSLLTYQAMKHDNVNVIGWIANCIDPNMLYADENIATLKQLLPIPCLDIIRFSSQPKYPPKKMP